MTRFGKTMEPDEKLLTISLLLPLMAASASANAGIAALSPTDAKSFFIFRAERLTRRASVCKRRISLSEEPFEGHWARVARGVLLPWIFTASSQVAGHSERT
jgi:hypothetical protein